jgi:hypothetical protein
LISNLRFLPVLWRIIANSSIGYLDSQNIDIAVRISSRCYLVYKPRYAYLMFKGRHLGFSISGCLLICDSHQRNASGMSVIKNVGIANGVLFVTGVELKIYCMLYLLLPVLNRHIGYPVGARFVLLPRLYLFVLINIR